MQRQAVLCMAEVLKLELKAPKWLVDDAGAKITFSVRSAADARAICDAVGQDDWWVADLKKMRAKRSKNANDLLWELCTRISEVLSNDGLHISKEDVYHKHIKDSGVCDFVVVREEGVDAMMRSWQKSGIGWFAEVVDFIPGKEIKRCKKVCLYYGSSTYDSKEMARLIDAVMQEAHDLGIQTISPREQSLLLERWGA